MSQIQNFLNVLKIFRTIISICSFSFHRTIWFCFISNGIKLIFIEFPTEKFQQKSLRYVNVLHSKISIIQHELYSVELLSKVCINIFQINHLWISAKVNYCIPQTPVYINVGLWIRWVFYLVCFRFEIECTQRTFYEWTAGNIYLNYRIFYEFKQTNLKIFLE